MFDMLQLVVALPRTQPYRTFGCAYSGSLSARHVNDKLKHVGHSVERILGGWVFSV